MAADPRNRYYTVGNQKQSQVLLGKP